jgi:hypothetical protein
MPGELHRASAVMTLTVSVIVTVVLLLAAAETPAPRATHAEPAQPALSR